MSTFDKLMGNAAPERQPSDTRGGGIQGFTDEQAIERYRYLLKTAPPDAVEQAHEEAFARLSPEQRRTILQQLAADMPEYEQRPTGPTTDDPRSLARMATRAEMRRTGTLERVFGAMSGGGIAFGGLLAGSFLSGLAGTVLGSMVAQQFFDGAHGFAGSGLTHEQADVSDGARGSENVAADASAAGDMGDEFSGGDFGEDVGDFGDV